MKHIVFYFFTNRFRLNHILALTLITLSFVWGGCTNFKQDSTLLQIGDYKLTVADYEYMRTENAERYKLSEDDLKKRIIDDGYVNAYALDNRYDTIRSIQKKMKYAIRFYSAVSDGYVWNKTIKPLIKVTEADIKNAYDKKSLEYNIELIQIPTTDLLHKYLPSGSQLKSSSDFNTLKSKVSSESKIVFSSRYQKYPFIPSEIDAEKVIKAKPGDAWGPFETQYGYLFIHVAAIRKADNPPFNLIKDRIEKELTHYRTQHYVLKSQQEVLQRTNPVMFDSAISYMLSACDIKARKWNGADKRKILMTFKLNGKTQLFTIADFIDYIEYEPLYMGSFADATGIKNLLKNSIVDIYQYDVALKMNMLTDPEFLAFKRNRLSKIVNQYYKEKYVKPKIIITDAETRKFYEENIDKFKAPGSAEVLVYKFKDNPSASQCLMPIAVRYSKKPIPDQIRNQVKAVKVPEPLQTTLRLDDTSCPASLKAMIARLLPEQVSMPVPVNGEYWIIYIRSKSGLIIVPYEEVKSAIGSKLPESMGKKLMETQLTELKSTYPIKTNRIAEYLLSKEKATK